jgi:rhamnulokinase
MAINSLYQLVSMAKSKSPQMASASTFLNMPDLFNFWFSGLKASEYTITTTTQCYNPITNQWAWDLLKRLEIPTYILSQAYDLTNEGGYGGKICLLKNILVLWLL